MYDKINLFMAENPKVVVFSVVGLLQLLPIWVLVKYFQAVQRHKRNKES